MRRKKPHGTLSFFSETYGQLHKMGLIGFTLSKQLPKVGNLVQLWCSVLVAEAKRWVAQTRAFLCSSWWRESITVRERGEEGCVLCHYHFKFILRTEGLSSHVTNYFTFIIMLNVSGLSTYANNTHFCNSQAILK